MSMSEALDRIVQLEEKLLKQKQALNHCIILIRHIHRGTDCESENCDMLRYANMYERDFIKTSVPEMDKH